MKQSSKEKMIFEDAIEMAYVEDIMKHLGMGISEGFMDDIAEIFSKGCALNKMQAWGFLKVTMLIVEDITTQKLTEKIEFRYLKHTDGESPNGLNEWAGNAAYYIVRGRDGVRPTSDDLDAAIVEQVYKEINELLGFE